MAAEALLFDLDGTLGDTHRWYAEALAAECTTHAQELHRHIVGGTAAVTLADRLGIGRPRFLRACRAGLDRLPLYPGVRETLQRLRERGTPLGLVTSLSPAVMRVILEDPLLGRCFSAAVGAQAGLRRKPHPAPLLEALRRMGLRPSERVWYIGDHASDQAAARGAGVRFAWASFGYRVAPPVTADAVLRRFVDVLDL